MEMSDDPNNDEVSDRPQGTTGLKCAILVGKFLKIVSQIPSGNT